MSAPRVTLIERYLLRQIAWGALAATAVLLALLLLNRFARFLAAAATGELPIEAILTMAALRIPGYLGLLLPLTLFLATLLALDRLHRNSEMAVLRICGLSPARMTFVLFRIGLAGALVVALFALWFSPWAYAQSAAVQARAESSDALLHGLASGRFTALPGGGGGGILYAETVSADRRLLNHVFVRLRDGDAEMILSARRGRVVVPWPGAGRFFVLEEGWRYRGEPGDRAWSATRYARHGIRLGGADAVAEAAGAPPLALEAQSTAALWRSDARGAWIELQWRIALPVSTALLLMLAGALSGAAPRRGRFSALAPALLLYILYYNLLSVVRSSLEQGGVFGFWPLHGAFFLLLSLLVSLQQRPDWPRRMVRGLIPTGRR